MQRGNDGTMYQVYYDYRRGQETVNSAACGREYWISPNSKHPLYGIRFVYLVNGQRNRVVPTLYYETASGALKVYDNNVAAARLPNPFSPDLGIASNPNPTRPQVNRSSSSQPAQPQTNLVGIWLYSIYRLPSDNVPLKSSAIKIAQSAEGYRISPCQNNCGQIRQPRTNIAGSAPSGQSTTETYGDLTVTTTLSADGQIAWGNIRERTSGEIIFFAMERQAPSLSLLPVEEQFIKTDSRKSTIILGKGKWSKYPTLISKADLLADNTLGPKPVTPGTGGKPTGNGPGGGANNEYEPSGNKPKDPNPPKLPPQGEDSYGPLPEKPKNPNPWQQAADYVQEHPLETIGGVVFAGLAITGFVLCATNPACLTIAGNILGNILRGLPLALAALSKQPSFGAQALQPKQPQLTGKLTKGTSYGDPHMITFDGFKYSFQTVGEFTLVKSTDGNFEVQARQGAISNSVAMNTAVAMKIGNTRVALYAKNPPDTDTSTPLRVDGKPTKLENGTLELPGGGKIQGNSSYYLITAPTGEQVGINIDSGRMDIKPYISGQSGQYIGLLGNANGDPADDLRTRGGKVIPTKENSTYGQVSQALRNVLPVPAPLNQAEKIFFDVVYKEFGDSWRISQAESLFDYPPGKDTGTFTNRSFPNSYLSLNSLLPPQIRQAEEICRKAGVESELMDGCIFDVGQTGDASFAQSAANALLDTAKDRLLQELGNKIPVPPLPVPVRIPRIRL
jgi:hypothetical protein